MTTKSWNKLTSMLSNAMKEHVSESDCNAILESFEEQKNEVSKLFSTKETSKPKKDPSAPKKPKTSYIYYCMEQRDEVKNANPDMKATDVTAELGKMWRELSEEEKVPYVERAKKDKERYEDEKSSYTPSPEFESEKPKRSSKKERTGPKRALSSYMYFCQVMRDKIKSENPNMKATDVTTELGVRWKALTPKEKVPFEEKANEDKARYQSEKSLASHLETSNSSTTKSRVRPVASLPLESKKETVKSKSETKTTVQKSKPSVPTKTTKVKETPGYKLFYTGTYEELQEDHPEWSKNQLTEKTNQMWLSLTDEDREAYELEVLEDEEEDLSSGETLEDD